MKKILCFIWVIISIITIWNTVQANTWTIDTTNSWVQTITTRAQEQSIITDTDGLDTNLTRAQAAQLYINLAKSQRWTGKIIELMSGALHTGCIFTDIDENPYARVITTACQRWLLKGNKQLFKPDDNITPLESLVTLIRITYGAQDETNNPRYQSYIDLGLKKNIITASDLSMLMSGSTISTNQIMQRAYASTHNLSTHKWSWKRWWWVLLALILWALWRLLSHSITRDDPIRTLTWHQPSWVSDDLTVVEGIGPKVQQILYENDILTYESLSRLTAGHISNILTPYGSTYESMNPVTRPKQAQLARDSKRDELETLKQEIKRWV